MANFLFVLSRDDNEAATRCFQFAKIAHSKGHQTDVFFIDNGVRWADSGRDLDMLKHPPVIAQMIICHTWLKPGSHWRLNPVCQGSSG
jgi:predicted peroxiredoxin